MNNQFLAAILISVIAVSTRLNAHDHAGNPAPVLTDCDLTNPTNLVVSLRPFRDKLPIPAVIKPARTNFNYRVPVAPTLHYTNGLPEYDVPMLAITNHSFHADLPPVEVWGYTGTYPGPTFEVQTDSPILVNWQNRLPAVYPYWLPVDTNLHGVDDFSVRTVVHLHGSTSLPRYDGYPTNTFKTGEADQYFYGNANLSGTGATLWYHDHAMGVTGANVYSGLAGFYLLRNTALENALNLPRGKYEVPLVFQDRDISTNCLPASLSVGPFPWHNLAVVNGKVTPYLEVEPRKYRFRMLNGAGYRTFGLALTVTDLDGVPLPSPANNPVIPPTIYVIGNDNGFLRQTEAVPPAAPFRGQTNNFNLAPFASVGMMPGERVDAIIDFSKYINQNITVKTVLNTADPTNLVVGVVTNANRTVSNFITQVSVTNLMQFRVVLPLASPDTSQIPTNVISTNWVTTADMIKEAKVTREISLDTVGESPFPGLPFNPGPYPFALLDMKFFADPIAEFPHPGDTEIWSIVNLSNEAHPIHVHLLDFRVIDRTRLGSSGTNGWNGNIRTPPVMVTNYINDRIANNLKNLTNYLSTIAETPPVAGWESGPKDTVKAAPFAVTRIVMTWPTNEYFYQTRSGMSPDDSDTDGRYIYHCHILDHEDNDMMRPLQLMPLKLKKREVLLTAIGAHPAHSSIPHSDYAVDIETVTGEIYIVESTDNLSKPWTPVADLKSLRGTGGYGRFILPSAIEKARYYRVRTQ